jgi:hypothetical protein
MSCPRAPLVAVFLRLSVWFIPAELELGFAHDAIPILKHFVELSGMFARHRDDRKSCLLIGIQRSDEMHLDPIGGEAGPLNHDDQLIVLCRVFIQPTETLPTDPPIAPSVESK